MGRGRPLHTSLYRPDPLLENFCGFGSGNTCRGVLWGHGRSLISLPPLYGGNNSAAYGANNFGQIVGASETAALENNSNCAQEVLATQGALWQPLRYKHATALPPVAGDTDSSAYAIDDHGDAAGASGSCIDFPPNADELHPVLWRNGKTVALPTLGGTLDNAVNAINERGEMAGQSALTGNSTVHAAFWRSPRVITDLGTFPGDSYSLLFGINDEGQVVGGSGSQTQQRAALWQNGVVYDLNTLIPPTARYHLLVAISISDDGIIAGGAYDAVTGLDVSFAAIPTGVPVNRTHVNVVRPLVLPASVMQRIRQYGRKRFGSSGE